MNNDNKIEEEVIPNYIVEEFHKLYHGSLVWKRTSWLGTHIQKCPLDLMIYQEIIYRIKPDVIIETGTLTGGSALFLASILDMINNGKILTIDIVRRENLPVHPRIEYLTDSSTSEKALEVVKANIQKEDVVLVILDSDHSREHVLREMQLYSQFVTAGSYMIVEDTNLNGNPIKPEFGPGPKEAIEIFMAENDGFYVDEAMHKFFLTFNPGGYLKRK